MTQGKRDPDDARPDWLCINGAFFSAHTAGATNYNGCVRKAPKIPKPAPTVESKAAAHEASAVKRRARRKAAAAKRYRDAREPHQAANAGFYRG